MSKAATERLQPLLLVDASLQGVQAALVDQRPEALQRILWQGAHNDNKGAVQKISALIGAGFSTLGLAPEQLGGLAVGVGPGSFTGIKVGLAFAYGLKAARASELPMLAVSSLEAAATALARQVGGDVALCLPATRTHGFIAVASPSQLAVPTRLLDTESTAAAFLAQLEAATRLYFAAPWPLLEALASIHKTAVQPAATTPSEVLTLPALAALALPVLVEQMLGAWPDGFSSALPLPRYQRLSTAEERLQQVQSPQQQPVAGSREVLP